MDSLIKILEDNYKVILTDYENFSFGEHYGVKTKSDLYFNEWKNEYNEAFKRIQQKSDGINPVQKFEHWYAYEHNEVISWETILIAYKGRKFILPTSYGKKFFFNTMKLFKNFKEVEKIAVAKLVSGAKIPLHSGNSKFYRIHLGLQVPDGDIAFKVNNNILKWQEGRCFCFNDSDPHMAWNNTEYDRIVLIVDVNG